MLSMNCVIVACFSWRLPKLMHGRICHSQDKLLRIKILRLLYGQELGAATSTMPMCLSGMKSDAWPEAWIIHWVKI